MDHKKSKNGSQNLPPTLLYFNFVATLDVPEASEQKNVISICKFGLCASSQFEKMEGILSFRIFPLSSNIFSSLMESWCNVLMENQSFFLHKMNIKKVQNPLHILLIYKQTTEYISKKASQ